MMKKKLLSSVLVFLVAWLAAGMWDCGCLFAAPVDAPIQTIQHESEIPSCHQQETASSNQTQSDDACCPGCRVEESAPVPPSIELFKPFKVNYFTKKAVTELIQFGSIILTKEERSKKFLSHWKNDTLSVSTDKSPLYIVVQSLLI
jgi:hypothetical protein